MAMEIIDSIDTDGDGKLSQAEIDKVRDDRHAAHDGDSDGNLCLDEFAGVWHETTRPLTVRAFQMLDTDGNAVISRAGVQQAVGQHRRAAGPQRRRQAVDE